MTVCLVRSVMIDDCTEGEGEELFAKMQSALIREVGSISNSGWHENSRALFSLRKEAIF